MSELLFENPLLIGLTGAAAVAIALATWWYGSYRSALYTAIGLALLSLVLFEVNVFVKTDRESVIEQIHAVAADLEKNRHEQVIAAIHPEATEWIRRAKADLHRHKFSMARITGIKQVTVKPGSQPLQAIAEFHVAFNAAVSGYELAGRRFVRVTFQQSSGKWLVREFEHFEPTAGFKANGP